MKKAWIVFDPLLGDGGKGAMVDYLTALHAVPWNVRFNGGAQAAHNVMLDDFRQHTFRMYGSGTFAGASTYLSPFVRVDPYEILYEGAHLFQLGVHDFPSRMHVHEDCLLTTPYHRKASEVNPDNHLFGSCFMGVWETQAYASKFPDYALRLTDLSSLPVLRDKLLFMAQHYNPGVKVSELKYLADLIADDYNQSQRYISIVDDAWWKGLLNSPVDLVFEGAQGVLLDPKVGYTPYVTSTTCTTANADALLEGRRDGMVEKIAVIRAYATRHGNGPFPTEESRLTDRLPELHNVTNPGQGHFRRGWLDAATLATVRNTIDGGYFDSLCVSHLDYWDRLPEWKIALNDPINMPLAYVRTNVLRWFLNRLSEEVGAPISHVAYGPRRMDRGENDGQGNIRYARAG